MSNLFERRRLALWKATTQAVYLFVNPSSYDYMLFLKQSLSPIKTNFGNVRIKNQLVIGYHSHNNTSLTSDVTRYELLKDVAVILDFVKKVCKQKCGLN